MNNYIYVSVIKPNFPKIKQTIINIFFINIIFSNKKYSRVLLSLSVLINNKTHITDIYSC